VKIFPTQLSAMSAGHGSKKTARNAVNQIEIEPNFAEAVGNR